MLCVSVTLMLAYFTIFYLNDAIATISGEFQEVNVCQTPEDYDNRTLERCWYHQDVDLTPSQIIKKHGYPLEEHQVITEDGFYLQLYRIPHGKNSNSTKVSNKQPVFLQHGFLSSGAIWVISGNRSLAFFLADKGYDVWIANSRGTTYSQGHETATKSSPKYWDWSFHEMGIYDLPASLDKVVATVGRNDTIFISMSLGAQIGYVYALTKPEETKDRLALMINIAPGIYPGDNEMNFYLVTQFQREIQNVMEGIGYLEMLNQSPYMRKIWENLCFSSSNDFYNCMNILFDFVGEDYEQLLPETLPLIIGHHPAGTSLKYVLHLAQNINKECFCAYDYGEDNNLILYRNDSAPEYDMNQLTIPTYIIYSRGDKKCNQEAAETLYSKIPEKLREGLFEINNTSFNHIDFIFAKDVVREVYNNVLEVMEKFN